LNLLIRKKRINYLKKKFKIKVLDNFINRRK